MDEERKSGEGFAQGGYGGPTQFSGCGVGGGLWMDEREEEKRGEKRETGRGQAKGRAGERVREGEREVCQP